MDRHLQSHVETILPIEFHDNHAGIVQIVPWPMTAVAPIIHDAVG